MNACIAAALLLALSSAEGLAGPETPQQAQGLATLTIAIGTVDLKPPGAADFAPAAAGAAIPADTWVRTAPKTVAAIDFPDGSELRLAEGTEVHLIERRKAFLKAGTGWWSIKNDAAPYRLESKFASISFPSTISVLTFVNRDPNSEEYKTVSRTETILQVLEGTVQVVGRKDKQPVGAGWQCNLIDAQLNVPDAAPNFAVSTAWCTPILLARGKANDEVGIRVELLWTGLGNDRRIKASEAALRELGAWSAPHLTQALRRAGPETENDRRRAAARVLADVAPASVATGLAAILKDRDPELRSAAARALKRITGQDLGTDAAAWEDYLKKNPAK